LKLNKLQYQFVGITKVEANAGTQAYGSIDIIRFVEYSLHSAAILSGNIRNLAKVYFFHNV